MASEVIEGAKLHVIIIPIIRKLANLIYKFCMIKMFISLRKVSSASLSTSNIWLIFSVWWFLWRAIITIIIAGFPLHPVEQLLGWRFCRGILFGDLVGDSPLSLHRAFLAGENFWTGLKIFGLNAPEWKTGIVISLRTIPGRSLRVRQVAHGTGSLIPPRRAPSWFRISEFLDIIYPRL